jgi:hypothetical protein
MFLVGQVGTSIPSTAKKVPVVKKIVVFLPLFYETEKFGFFSIKLNVPKNILIW